MDRDSFIVCIERINVDLHITKYVQTRFDSSNYKIKTQPTSAINQKVILLTENELVGKKKHAYVDKKDKEIQKCVVARN